MNLNNNGVRYRLAYPENASFLPIFDLSSSHKAQSKEHMQKIKHFPLYFLFVKIAQRRAYTDQKEFQYENKNRKLKY